MYRKKSHPEIRGSLAEQGGLFMMSMSAGLKPRAVAGSPSVTRLTHRYQCFWHTESSSQEDTAKTNNKGGMR